MNQFKDFSEQYCPYIGANVPTQVTYGEFGKPVKYCLNSFRCPRTKCSMFLHNPEPLVIQSKGD